MIANCWAGSRWGRFANCSKCAKEFFIRSLGVALNFFRQLLRPSISAWRSAFLVASSASSLEAVSWRSINVWSLQRAFSKACWKWTSENKLVIKEHQSSKLSYVEITMCGRFHNIMPRARGGSGFGHDQFGAGRWISAATSWVVGWRDQSWRTELLRGSSRELNFCSRVVCWSRKNLHMFHQKTLVVHRDSVDAARTRNNLQGLGFGLADKGEHGHETPEELKPWKKEIWEKGKEV